jgi:hypothetical protein
MLQPFYSTSGLLNQGDIAGLSDALAAQLVAHSIAAEYDAGSGAGVVTASPMRGQGEWETDAQYEAAGGSSGNLNPGAAIQGVEGETTIVRGRAVPNSEPWA